MSQPRTSHKVSLPHMISPSTSREIPSISSVLAVPAFRSSFRPSFRRRGLSWILLVTAIVGLPFTSPGSMLHIAWSAEESPDPTVPVENQQELPGGEADESAQREESPAASETSSASEDEKVYSGPQPGEPLVGFASRLVLGDEAGQEVDFVTQAGDQPLLLIFVHEITRPSVAVIRAISKYATHRAEDGLQTAIVFLTADATETEAFLQRARHALPPDVPVGISLDGLEGPGEYGLNRHVSLTILVGKQGETTSNFALIQPSVQNDVLPVVQSIIDVLGSGSVPPLERLADDGYRMQRAAPGEPPADGVSEDRLRSLLQPLIRRNARPEDVQRIAVAVEQEMEKSPPLRNRIGTIAAQIVAADKLENYGSPAAQEVLRRWAEEFGPEATKNEVEEEVDSESDSLTSEFGVCGAAPPRLPPSAAPDAVALDD